MKRLLLGSLLSCMVVGISASDFDFNTRSIGTSFLASGICGAGMAGLGYRYRALAGMRGFALGAGLSGLGQSIYAGSRLTPAIDRMLKFDQNDFETNQADFRTMYNERPRFLASASTFGLSMLALIKMAFRK